MQNSGIKIAYQDEPCEYIEILSKILAEGKPGILG
jgi:hypothetical protein